MGSGPFDDLRLALSDISQPESVEDRCLDHGRRDRAGIPEIVMAGGKPVEEVILSLRELAAPAGRAVASRCSDAQLAQIERELSAEFTVETNRASHYAVVAQLGSRVRQTGGVVGILTAGSSDAPVAGEAAMIAREMGATVLMSRDVGVAGIHRLVEPLERFVAAGVDVFVVCAGMDGVLPSVVSGLVAAPVIGVPTSTGYGFGGQGLGALTTMLQSCSPGVVVVNIDNGIGAGATAALIANRVAAARRAEQPLVIDCPP